MGKFNSIYHYLYVQFNYIWRYRVWVHFYAFYMEYKTIKLTIKFNVYRQRLLINTKIARAKIKKELQTLDKRIRRDDTIYTYISFLSKPKIIHKMSLMVHTCTYGVRSKLNIIFCEIYTKKCICSFKREYSHN